MSPRTRRRSPRSGRARSSTTRSRPRRGRTAPGGGPSTRARMGSEKGGHFGEAVAAVIAEDRYIAEDACDLIEVEYEPLPAVPDPLHAPAGARPPPAGRRR